MFVRIKETAIYVFNISYGFLKNIWSGITAASAAETRLEDERDREEAEGE